MREGGRGGAQHTAARAGPHPAAPNFVSVEQPERSGQRRSSASGLRAARSRARCRATAAHREPELDYVVRCYVLVHLGDYCSYIETTGPPPPPARSGHLLRIRMLGTHMLSFAVRILENLAAVLALARIFGRASFGLPAAGQPLARSHAVCPAILR